MKRTSDTNEQALVSELRTASPSVARLTDLAVWREREAFEEKQSRALVLLRKKDAKIRELGEAVARHNNISRQRAEDARLSAAAEASSVRPGGSGAGDGRRGGGGGRGGVTAGRENRGFDDTAASAAAVVQRLEGCVEDQANQIEALLEEVMRLGQGFFRFSELQHRPVWFRVEGPPAVDGRNDTLGELGCCCCFYVHIDRTPT